MKKSKKKFEILSKKALKQIVGGTDPPVNVPKPPEKPQSLPIQHGH